MRRWSCVLLGVLLTVVAGAPSTAVRAAAVPLAGQAGGPLSADASYVSLTPVRLMDSRPHGATVDGAASGEGPVTSASPRSLQVSGRGGVPSTGVGAVVLNVTGVAPSTATFLTVYPTGEAAPQTSNLNLATGQTAANLVVVKLPPSSGAVTVRNSLGSANVVVDVAGYYPSGPGFTPLSPARLLDTRTPGATVDGSFSGGGPVGPGATLDLQVTGRDGIPSTGVAAVVLNLTGVSPTGPTFVTAYPTGAGRPNASSLNLAAKATTPNLVLAKVGTDGRVSLANSTGSVHLLADVAGWIPEGTSYTPLTPARFLDTRPASPTFDGLSAGGGPVGPGGSVVVKVTGRGGIPATADAVVVNLTVVASTSSTFLTAYPTGSSRPGASNLNVAAREVRSNLAIVKLGPSGTFTLANSTGQSPVIVDVVGWFDGPPAPSVVTATLPDGVAGAPYLAVLALSGGVAPYSWTATGLPSGLALAGDGVLTGTPAATGASSVTLTVTDARGLRGSTTTGLAVPLSLPAGCQGQSCAQLVPRGATVKVPPTAVSSVARDPSTHTVASLTLTGTAPAAGQVLVVAPTPDLPTGLVAVVTAVTPNGDGTVTAAVTVGGPADAYDEGAVHATAPGAFGPARAAVARAGQISCTGGVSSSVQSLDVSPSLRPQVAALWKHPPAPGGGGYPGNGGLSLFQVDLDGIIATSFSVSVSGASTCTMALPVVHTAVPAGDLGAVGLDITPTLTLTVTGKVAIDTSVTLACGAEYRWSQTASGSAASYCRATTRPLAMTTAAADATLTGDLGVSLAMDDVVAFDGTITSSVQAGDDPAGYPTARLGAKVTSGLSSCLSCLWKGGPDRQQVLAGTWFDKVLATYDTAPPPAPVDPPVVSTTSLRSGTVGSPYSTQLTTADRRPGSWSVGGGALPPGLTLSGATVTGTPTDRGTYRVVLVFTDTAGTTATATTSLTVDATAGATPSWGSLTAGDLHTCGVRTDGTAWCWGYDRYGQLGTGSNTSTSSTVPVQVGTATTWAQLTAGANHTCGVRTDGTAWCWGDNENGELGTGGTTDSPVPVQVGTETTWATLTAGGSHTCGVRTDGTAWCWGFGGLGQLGTGDTTDSPVPVQVGTATTWATVSAGSYHSCGVRTDGTAWCWGHNGSAQLGTGGTTGSPVPVQVGTATTWATVSAGTYHSCGVRTDGTAWCWGQNGDGELGTGGTTDSPVPVRVGTATTWVSLDTGDRHTCGVRSDTTAWCWGYGADGELGRGTTVSSQAPVQVGNTTTWATLTAGGGHTCGVRTDATAWCWGHDGLGELGDGGTTDSAVPVPVALAGS